MLCDAGFSSFLEDALELVTLLWLEEAAVLCELLEELAPFDSEVAGFSSLLSSLDEEEAVLLELDEPDVLELLDAALLTSTSNLLLVTVQPL